MTTTGIAMPPGMHRFSQMERVVWGVPIVRALKDELDLLDCRRVFVVTNRSLTNSPQLAEIIATLGDRYVGRFDEVRAHTPRECVIEGTHAAWAANADKLLAVGGGSVIDAAKAMLLCLRHGYSCAEQLEPHANVRQVDLGHTPSDAAEWIRIIAVPTTLSGAEFAASAGVSDLSKGLKQAFVNPMQMPQSVLLDPAMTYETPIEMLKSTGMKAIDHAAERMTSRTANPYSDSVSELALRLLSGALRELDACPSDPDLRSRLQYGMFMSLCGSASGVAVNVSHAIGHVLGAHASVPHGHTTGVLLPAVLNWMAAETIEPQKRIAAAIRGSTTENHAPSVVTELTESLRLPARLRETGIKRDDLPIIAEKTMHEALLKNSPRPVQNVEHVLEILDLAW